jgi:2-polyprenyl-3-methyl-5-hydroxy-6-metoxy-1,4-benzoquinol methylase
MTNPATRIITIYQEHAADYDHDRSRVLMERAWLDRFLETVPAGGTVLDLGCGMGEPMAAFLVGRGLRVTGVDPSPELINLARSRMPEQEWIVADMRDLALGRRFDAILAWDSLFHLTRDDQRQMFSIFDSHTSPDAMLMFTSGPDEGEVVGNLWGQPLYHASLSPAEYRSLLNSHEFDEVAHQVEDPDCGHHTIWLARKRE